MEQRLIDANKLREELEYHTFAENSAGEFIRDRILKIVDDQPEVKAPFKAVAEIKVDEDKLRSICKEQLKKMMKQNSMPLQEDTEAEFNGWIPVKERLPEESEEVLITEDGGAISIATFEGYGFSDAWHGDDCENDVSEIIAWRPLPRPYKGNEE